MQPARKTAFPLDLHIPGWCTAPSLSVNGTAVAVERNAKGFVRLSRNWKPGDTVRLRLPMTASVHKGAMPRRARLTTGRTGSHR